MSVLAPLLAHLSPSSRTAVIAELQVLLACRMLTPRPSGSTALDVYERDLDQVDAGARPPARAVLPPLPRCVPPRSDAYVSTGGHSDRVGGRQSDRSYPQGKQGLTDNKIEVDLDIPVSQGASLLKAANAAKLQHTEDVEQGRAHMARAYRSGQPHLAGMERLWSPLAPRSQAGEIVDVAVDAATANVQVAP